MEKWKKDTSRVGEQVTARIDRKTRQRIANNHTATHLLHWALQEVLGPHIRQAGSLVEEKRLRFDFNHHKALTKEEVRHIEQRVNQKIREGKPVKTYTLSYSEAQSRPDIKQFFGEKYGSTVRVVDIDDSKELCGGTHTSCVSTLGSCRITKESSIASGVRRIEAVTGKEAEEFNYASEEIGEKAAELLKVPVSNLSGRISALLEENKHLSQELKQLKKGSLKTVAKELLSQTEQVGAYSFIGQIVSVDAELLPQLLEEVMSQLHSGVIVLGKKGDGRCQLMALVSADLTHKGIQAVQLIKEIAPSIGGSGGGRAESAQAGGKLPEGLEEALHKARQWLANH